MSSIVQLRSFDRADAPLLAALFAEDAVRQWNPGPTPDVVDRWWHEANAAVLDRQSRTWAVTDAVDDRLLGTVSVFDVHEVTREAEIGYRVLGAETGRGVATAALLAAVPRATVELGIRGLRLQHALDNRASCRVATKGGFAAVATVPGVEAYGDGRLHPEHVHRWSTGAEQR